LKVVEMLKKQTNCATSFLTFS